MESGVQEQRLDNREVSGKDRNQGKDETNCPSRSAALCSFLRRISFRSRVYLPSILV